MRQREKKQKRRSGQKAESNIACTYPIATSNLLQNGRKKRLPSTPTTTTTDTTTLLFVDINLLSSIQISKTKKKTKKITIATPTSGTRCTAIRAPGNRQNLFRFSQTFQTPAVKYVFVALDLVLNEVVSSFKLLWGMQQQKV